MITAKQLIGLGHKPGPGFRSVLEHVQNNQLSGKELLDYIESLKPKIQELLPYPTPVEYFKNIRAENPDEQDNLDKVFQTMDFIMCTPTAVTGAVMPDACPTGPDQIPVGGVMVARNAIHPAMHSADICCSVMLSNFGNTDPLALLDAAHKATHFGPGGRNSHSTLPEDILDQLKSNSFTNLQRSLNLAHEHLATQGDGNHFLYVGKLESTGETVMVTHHGSRGLGALLYKQGMHRAEEFRRKISPQTSPKNAWIPFDTQDGEDYWQALQTIRAWTKLNHDTIHEATGFERTTTFWNEHNFVFRDKDLFYHAKGATPLDDKFVPDSVNGLRIIPLNMAEPILIVKGKTTGNNLGFAPHGAGRNTSRTQHIRSKQAKTDQDIFLEETQGLDIRFFSNNIDISELPSAYKNAQTVQQQMKDFGLGQVVDRVLPFGSIMAGDWQKTAPWRNKKQKR